MRMRAYIIAVVAGWPTVMAGANGPSFTVLGHLPGGNFARGYGLSANGRFVVGDDSGRAFVWSAETGMVDIGTLPGDAGSRAAGVSDSGVVVGTSGSGAGHAFRWSIGDGMVGLGTLPTFTESEAHAVSADGFTIVGVATQYSGFPTAFRWTAAEGISALAAPPSMFYSEANAVSADGSVIVGSSWGDGGMVATRWTAAGPAGMGVVVCAPYYGCGYIEASHGEAVSSDGQFAAGYTRTGPIDPPTIAFQWSAASGMIVLSGDLGGYNYTWWSEAHGISDGGSAIAGRTWNGAFLWRPDTGMRYIDAVLTNQYGLDLGGWTLFDAAAISADGLTIAGTGQHGNDYSAWVAHIDRCPGDWDHDGVYTPADVAAFVAAWVQSLSDGTTRGDFDLDGAVTAADIAEFVGLWFSAATGACS